ncbi:hypothetical protein [Endozoicomonas ascidiicola]|uniref:hypothetical protein n=1 Tax=Endozoicomonas ascidiicola TaxID=1698521 RepID=UPI00082BDD9F|nr:hypothetical protein [Endozoicomonas ascidiicola]
MSQLTPDDLALAIEIKQKEAAGLSSNKEVKELAKKVMIADRIGDEMEGQLLNAENVLIEMTTLIVAITVGIHSPQARDQAMLVTGLILQRLRENEQPTVVHESDNIH